MSLPKIDLPTYKVKLFSRDEELSFRPYTVREEKNMLLALEGRDEKEIVAAVENLVSACVIEDIDIKKLPAFDLEFLFLQIRCRSVSQIAEFRMTFKDCPNEPKCLREVSIDLSKVEVVAPHGHSRKIPLTDSIGVMMRYPTMELMEKIAKAGASGSNIESLYEIIGGCIESVWQGKKVIPADTVPPAEVRDFIESLSREQFTKLMAFFETMPTVKTTVTQLCSTCGKEVSAEVRGLQNFFS